MYGDTRFSHPQDRSCVFCCQCFPKCPPRKEKCRDHGHFPCKDIGCGQRHCQKPCEPLRKKPDCGCGW